MLTKEQIETYWDWHECNCKFAFDSPTSFEVCKQARQAIDLAAENELLKAKLDAVREIVLMASMPYGGPHADFLAIEEIYNLIVEDKEET